MLRSSFGLQRGRVRVPYQMWVAEMALLAYGCAALLLAAAFLLRSRLKGKNVLRARKIAGSNLIIGDVHGHAVQTSSTGGRKEQGADHIGWLIAIVGVAVAGFQLLHDLGWAW
jgi:hypothetical protein